jgi:glycosyltransferase involved in cell wall biosynthesis
VLKVSVVIPTWNRADLLVRTIDKIEKQTVSRELYEVLVIDNASTDCTLSILQEKSKTYSNLKVFSQLKRGAAATRNVGIRAATGEIVLFIDDDIQAEPNLIEEHLNYHRTHKRASIIGSVITPWSDRRDPFLRYLSARGICNPYSIACGPLDFSYYHTGNVSTSRAALAEAGCFNEEFLIYGKEDIELGYRLEKLGCRMVYAANAKALHEYFPTYDQFIQRCEQAGFSLGKLIELHPELRKRFIENGKRTHWLKRLHFLYRLFATGAEPFCRLLTKREERKGSGPVTPLLDIHYYWAIRYHFFLGYTQYVKHARSGQSEVVASRLSGERIPKLAIDRRKVV